MSPDLIFQNDDLLNLITLTYVIDHFQSLTHLTKTGMLTVQVAGIRP